MLLLPISIVLTTVHNMKRRLNLVSLYTKCDFNSREGMPVMAPLLLSFSWCYWCPCNWIAPATVLCCTLLCSAAAARSSLSLLPVPRANNPLSLLKTHISRSLHVIEVPLFYAPSFPLLYYFFPFLSRFPSLSLSLFLSVLFAFVRTAFQSTRH